MTIVTTDRLASSSHSTDITSTLFYQVDSPVPRPVTTSGLPSLFELLFSEKIGSSLSANSADQSNRDDSVSGNGDTLKSARVESVASKSKATGNSETAGVSAFVNPLTLTFAPQLSAKAVYATPATAKTTGKESSSETKSRGNIGLQNVDSPNAAETQSASESKGSAALDSHSASQFASLVGDQQPVEATPLPHAATPATDAVNQSAQTASVVVTELAIKNLSAEAIHRVTEKDIESNSKIPELSSVELKTTQIASAFNASRGLAFDSLEVENIAGRIDAVHPREATQKPTRRIDDSSSANSAIVPTINLSRSAGTDSSTPISDQLATEIARHVSKSTQQGPTVIRIQLNRTDLGPVSLHLSINNDVVSIRIVTQDQVSQQIINNQMNDLRQSLINSGIMCGDCQVACDSNGQSFSGQNGTAADPFARRASSNSRWARPQSNSPAATQSASAGRLNFVA